MDAHVVSRPHLEQRMKKLAFSYTSPANSQLSQAVLSPPSQHLQGRAPAQSGDPSQARRKMVSSAVQDYLKSCLNSMARSIVLEKETVEHEHQKDWAVMNSAKREEVVDEHFIPCGVRAHYHGDSLVGDWRRSPFVTVADSSKPLHLSQPSVWEQEEYEANSNLVLKNKSATWTSDELSLSQPSLSDHGHPATFTSTHRLHKKQLSFRKNHAIRPLPPVSSYPHPRDNLGSDGESPRTSDEDSSGSYNALGFHRSKLRSYSMRPRRSNARNSGVRSSVRGAQKIRRPLTPDADTDRRIHSSRHVHEHSSTKSQYNDDPDIDYPDIGYPDIDYDDEIDLPDESLLLDHVQEPVAESTPVKPQRYSRNRRSQRSNKPLQERKPAYDSTATVVKNRYTSTSPSELDITTTSDSSLPSFSIDVPSQSQTAVIPNALATYLSHESLDTDSMFSQSLVSKSIHASDDALSEHSRVMTPDSMVSSSSISSSRPKSKQAEIAIMRKPRGGSFYRTATSDFADRHTQFKPNMLRSQRSAQNSASTTREGTPCASTPVPPEQGAEDEILSQPAFLKPPGLTLSISKHGSLVESETTDLPSSPEHLSPICSPVHMPLLQTAHLLHSNRESGYISGSCESFAMKR